MDASRFRGVHTRRIITHCLLVVTPLLASSFIVVYIVYTNLVSGGCPSKELCPEILNDTSENHYYIDFPAARLAFISSGSATVSFALLAVIMAMHSYSNAASFIHTSAKSGQGSLPSPHQMSVLLRVLNAELAVLWDLAYTRVRRVFWDRERETNSSAESTRLLGVGIIVLLAGLVARFVTHDKCAKEAIDMVATVSSSRPRMSTFI
jgi:hypothetical protein